MLIILHQAQQSFGGVASSSALNVPQLNLPESVRAPSQQSLTENGALQEVQVPGRPPIPSRWGSQNIGTGSRSKHV